MGPGPAAVLLEVLDPAQNNQWRDAFVELPFDLSEVLFITTANETAPILPALRDRLEIIDLPPYSEDREGRHRPDAPDRGAEPGGGPCGHAGAVHAEGACRRIVRDHTSEPGVATAGPLPAGGLPPGGAGPRDRGRLARARPGHRAAGAGRFSVRRAPATATVSRICANSSRRRHCLPAVRERGHEVLARLSAWAPTDPDHARAREYLECLLSVPWTRRTAAAPLDLARARSVLDAGHAAHEEVKERLIDYVAVRLSNPDAPSPLLCLLGPPGVGKSTLAALVAAALGRACAWVSCGGLANAAALCGTRSGSPGRIVDELRRVSVRNPLVVLDEIDRLDEAGGTAAALLDALDPAPGAAFRDHYLDLSFDLSEALFVATATSLGPVPAMVRERMTVVEMAGYTEAEKQAIVTGHLLPRQMALYGLTADQVQVTDEAVGALIRGHTREAGVWRLRAGAGHGVREGGARPGRGRHGAGRGDAAHPGRDVRGAGIRRRRRAHRATGRRHRTEQLGARRRRGALHRSNPDARRRRAHPHRPPGGGHAGVGAHRAVVAPGPRRPLRPRRGLPRATPISMCTCSPTSGRSTGPRPESPSPRRWSRR